MSIARPAAAGQLAGRSATSKTPGDVKSADPSARSGSSLVGSRDDLELVDRFRAGDTAVFEELYRHHAGRLFNLVYRMAGGHVAEDLLQEVFLTAYRKIGGFRGESSLGTWLYRLAVNQCLDHLRGRQTSMGKVTDSLDDERAEPVSNTPIGGPITRMDLERAIEQLPPGSRAAFVLHDVEGFEHREIAQMLNISTGTSKSQVHKARMKLRGLLGARGRGQ